MQRMILTAVALALVSPIAMTDSSMPPPRGGPPIDEIATRLQLDETQKTEVKRILDAAHERMEAARKASMQQVDNELAAVLTAGQVAQFRKLMQESRRRGPPPGSRPSSN